MRARGNSHMRHIYSTCLHCRSQQKELERERMANFSIDSILGNLTNTQTPRRLPTKRSFSVPAAPLPVLPLTGEKTFLQTFGPVQQSGLLVPKMPALLTLPPTPQRCVSNSEEPARSPLFAVETTVGALGRFAYCTLWCWYCRGCDPEAYRPQIARCTEMLWTDGDDPNPICFIRLRLFHTVKLQGILFLLISWTSFYSLNTPVFLSEEHWSQDSSSITHFFFKEGFSCTFTLSIIFCLVYLLYWLPIIAIEYKLREKAVTCTVCDLCP